MAGALEGGGGGKCQQRGAGGGGGKCERWGRWDVWAVRAAVKYCFPWQALEGGGKCERVGGEGGVAVRAVRAVWAVRAAGVGHGLEPVIKHCFSWQWRWGR